MIHLTLTGYYAGSKLCGNDRDNADQHVHAIYAPLDKPEYRRLCCEACLAVWDDSFNDSEE